MKLSPIRRIRMHVSFSGEVITCYASPFMILYLNCKGYSENWLIALPTGVCVNGTGV